MWSIISVYVMLEMWKYGFLWLGVLCILICCENKVVWNCFLNLGNLKILVFKKICWIKNILKMEFFCENDEVMNYVFFLFKFYWKINLKCLMIVVFWIF